MKDNLISAAVIISLIAGNLGFGLGILNTMQPKTAAPSFGSFSPTGGGTYLLQSSISASQNTITLTSFTEPGSGIKYTMSYIGTDIIYGTVAPSSGNSEFISATGITQNSNGTATLTGVTRGESRTPGTGGCVASSTLAHAFPGQTQFILSNSPCFYSEYAVRRNKQTIAGPWTFTQAIVGVTPTSTSQLATKGYVDGVAIAGAPNAQPAQTGIVRIATGAQAAANNSSVNPYLVLSTAISSDDCTAFDNLIPVTNNNVINGNCIDQSFAYDFTHYISIHSNPAILAYGEIGIGIADSNGTAITVSQGNVQLGAGTTTANNIVIASTTPKYGYSLNVGGMSLFTGGVSLGLASTTMGNGTLVVSRLASTSNMIISNSCTGCLSGYTISTTTANYDGGTPAQVTATISCAAGKKILSGSFDTDPGDAPSLIIRNFPLSSSSWRFVLQSSANGVSDAVTFYAICVNQ